MVRPPADPEALLRKCARLRFYMVLRPHGNDGRHGFAGENDNDEASYKSVTFDFSVTPLHELSEDTSAKELAQSITAGVVAGLKKNGVKNRVNRGIRIEMEEGQHERRYVSEVDHFRAFLEAHNRHVQLFQALLESPDELRKYFPVQLQTVCAPLYVHVVLRLDVDTMRAVGDITALVRRCERFRLYVLIGPCENKYRTDLAQLPARRLRSDDDSETYRRVPHILTKLGKTSEGKWRRGCEAEHLAAFKAQHAKCLAAFDALVQSGEVAPRTVIPRCQLMAQSRRDSQLRAARRLCADVCALVLDCSRSCRRSYLEGVLYFADNDYHDADHEDSLLVTAEWVESGPHECSGWQDEGGADLTGAGWMGTPQDTVNGMLRYVFYEYSVLRCKFHLWPGDACCVTVDCGEGVATVSVTKWGVTSTRTLLLRDYFGKPSAALTEEKLHLTLTATAADSTSVSASHALFVVVKTNCR
jgi:hypothetical protein